MVYSFKCCLSSKFLPRFSKVYFCLVIFIALLQTVSPDSMVLCCIIIIIIYSSSYYYVNM